MRGEVFPARVGGGKPKKVTANKAVADTDGNGRINLSDVVKLSALIALMK